MGFVNKEVELTIPPKNRIVQIIQHLKKKSLNGYDIVREKIDSEKTLTVKTPVEQPSKPKTKVGIGL